MVLRAKGQLRRVLSNVRSSRRFLACLLHRFPFYLRQPPVLQPSAASLPDKAVPCLGGKASTSSSASADRRSPCPTEVRLYLLLRKLSLHPLVQFHQQGPAVFLMKQQPPKSAVVRQPPLQCTRSLKCRLR